ncbi:MAG TPA: hypothetical protein VLW55_00865 [Burkholderiaceae bacterium]|nr:hypothetical protein [Burkholderiaceae bacterium]
MVMTIRAAPLVVLLLMPLGVLAQSDSDLKRFAEMDRQCEAARAKKLEPLRAEKIEACVKDDKRPRADCEEEFADYGNTKGKAGGGAIGGLFYDLPECVAATAARNNYRQ